MIIEVVRVPSLFAIAMGIAPLVRMGVLTETEARDLVDHRYALRCIELRRERGPA